MYIIFIFINNNYTVFVSLTFVDICLCGLINIQLSRLTVVSREAKKKQHACASSGPRDHYSELFTQMAALKF